LNKGIKAVKEISNLLNSPEEKIIKRTKELIEEKEEKEKMIIKYENRLVKYEVEKILKEVENLIIDGKEVKFLGKLVNVERKEMLDKIIDILIEKLGTGIVIIASKLDKKIYVLVKVSEDISDNVSAGAIVKEILPFIKGKGGGNNIFAQGSGEAEDGFQNGLKHVVDILKEGIKDDR